MNFDTEHAITEFLIKRGKPVYDADISRYVEKTLQKAVSPTTYSSSKRKLIAANIIEKIEIGSRGRVKYRISERAKQQHRLGILRFNPKDDIISLNSGQPQEERRLKTYFLVLYYSSRGSGRERRPESAIPGFSINEILNESRRPMFPDMVFAADEITQSVESLLKERIVHIITPFGEEDEIRYDLAEPLKSCLETFLSLWHRFVIDIITSHWEFFRKSLPEERIWLKHFFWKKAVDKNERNYYSKRLSFRKRTSQKEIQLHEYVIKEMFDEIDEEWRQAFNQNLCVLETYGSPVKEFLEFLYPDRLRNLYPDIKPLVEKLPPDPATTRARSRLWKELMNGLEAAFAENQSGTMETILEHAKSHILNLRAKEPVFGY